MSHQETFTGWQNIALEYLVVAYTILVNNRKYGDRQSC